MYLYEVYYNQNAKVNQVILSRHGFSIKAAIFSFLWAGYHGMWYILISGILINSIIIFGIGNPIMLALGQITLITISIFFGIFASDILTFHLNIKGYQLYDIVYANSKIDGEYKFYKKLLRKYTKQN